MTFSIMVCMDWIVCVQLFLNGVSYGPRLPASCNSVRVSGLAGGQVYKVVLEAYPKKKQLPLLKSNILVSNVQAIVIILNFNTSVYLSPTDIYILKVFCIIVSIINMKIRNFRITTVFNLLVSNV